MEKYEASSVDYYQFILMDIQMPIWTAGGRRRIREMDRPDAAGVKYNLDCQPTRSGDIDRARQAAWTDI
ncbi:MAG: hypothetical protein ACLVLH_13425 [Eisenbergiella massiliensis]